MSLETRNMVKWLKEQKIVTGSKSLINRETVLIVERAFKHDTVQMVNERILITEALNLKREFEKVVV